MAGKLDFMAHVQYLAERLDLSEPTLTILMDSPVGISSDKELSALPKNVVAELRARLAKHAGDSPAA